MILWICGYHKNQEEIMASKFKEYSYSNEAALKKPRLTRMNGFQSFIHSFVGYRKHLGLTIMFIPVIVYFIK